MQRKALTVRLRSHLGQRNVQVAPEQKLLEVLDAVGEVYGVTGLKIASKLYVDQLHQQRLIQKSISKNTKCGEFFRANGQLVFVKLPREE